MTEHEAYLHGLRLAHPDHKMRYSTGAFEPDFLNYFGIDPRDHQFDPEQYLQHLYDHYLKDSLPPELTSARKNDKLAWLFLSSLHPICHARHFDSGSAVVVSQGISRFVFRCFRLLCKFISTEHDTADNKMPVEEIGHRLAEIYWWFQQTGEPWGPSYPASVYQLEYASNLTTVAELFYFSHELAHVYFHIRKQSGNADIDFIKGIEEEFQADYWGASFVLAVQNIPVLMKIAGLNLALYIFDALERLGLDLSGTDHPLFAKRLEMIIAACMLDAEKNKYDLEKEGAFARDMSKIFGWVMAVVADCINGKNAAFERRKEDKKQQFNLIVAMQDYNQFEESLVASINEGFVHVLVSEAELIKAKALTGDKEAQRQYEMLITFFTMNDIQPVSGYFLQKLA